MHVQNAVLYSPELEALESDGTLASPLEDGSAKGRAI